jgi:F-type H+-transporting ATPase subunit c
MLKKIIFLAAAIALASWPLWAQPSQPAGARSASAANAQTEGPAPASQSGVKWGAIGAAFAIGVAAFAGALGQGRTAAAACEGMARNPGASGPIRIMALLGLAFIESLVIYAMVIAWVIRTM